MTSINAAFLSFQDQLNETSWRIVKIHIKISHLCHLIQHADTNDPQWVEQC